MIRNCCFEFEGFKNELLVYDAKLFSLLIKILVITNSNYNDSISLGINDIDGLFFPNFNTKIFNDKDHVPYLPDEKNSN